MVYKRVIFHCHLCTFPRLHPSPSCWDPLDRWTHRRQCWCLFQPFFGSKMWHAASHCSVGTSSDVWFFCSCIYIYIYYIYIYICVCVILYIYIYNVQMYVCMYVCVCDTFIFLQYAYILNMCPFAFVWVCVSPTSRTCALEKCVFVCVCGGPHAIHLDLHIYFCGTLL